ncbi:hypothetical protein [Aliihoeflea sp. 40Bstr573]|uniref:hypothetical protein n=1 Tax=Aliihoeflea sp. 40Bstr573 TaxID=2696467 RepID=UPI0020950422|nr:hypothetical protein [Aliihoeflea sp. 40Bstr573]MCO6387477.1 hypothetical protein [Aliihoeflea sp. 40Bstr573]
MLMTPCPDQNLKANSSLSGVVQRGSYGEILRGTLADGASIDVTGILACFASVLPEKFVEFDNKQRGDALNLELYGYDYSQGVAIVQIRHAFRRYRNGYLNVHKDYVLVGQNEETREFFRHPVSAHAVHAAIRKDDLDPIAPVRGAQRWMWSVTDKQLSQGIRQGDILIVPAKSRPPLAEPIDATSVMVGRTHEIHASAFCRDKKGIVWAFAPTVRHTKGQHMKAYGDRDCWHSVRVGREAPTWEWGARLGD